MNWDSYFTDQDKPFAENLNDSLVLTDAFDISVPVEMPTMFSNGEFSSTLNVTRKCNVGLVTLKSVGSGVTVGTSQISGSGEVVFRVYPNFNCFYKWDKIIVEKSGTVDISFRKVDGTEITASVGSDGIISDNNALKQLQEIDVVFTLSSATINNILIWFVNNQGTRNRTGARLEASQLANVNGEVVNGESKAVNGGTVKNALDNLHTEITGEIEDVEDKLDLKQDISYKTQTLSSSGTYYPSCNAVTKVTDTKENLSNKTSIIDDSSQHYPNNQAILPIWEILLAITNLTVTPTEFRSLTTSSVHASGNIAFSYIPQVMMRMRAVNKNTGEYAGTAISTPTFTESSSFTVGVKNLDDVNNYYYLLEVKYKVWNSSHQTLYVSPHYDKDGNIIG